MVGLAESVQIGAGGGGGGGCGTVTVTVALHCTEPPEPMAVPVYVVVTGGITDVMPDATGVTTPTL